MSIIAFIVNLGVIAVGAVALAISDSTGTYYCQSYSAFVSTYRFTVSVSVLDHI